MDKGRAKRDACWHAARLIEDNMTSTLWLDVDGDLAVHADYSPEDVERVRAAIELITELERRGHL